MAPYLVFWEQLFNHNHLSSLGDDDGSVAHWWRVGLLLAIGGLLVASVANTDVGQQHLARPVLVGC